MPSPARLSSRAALVGVFGLAVGLGFGLAPHIVATARGASPTATPQVAAGAVVITDSGFQPASLTIPQHTVVVWTNTGGGANTVTADDGSFDSGRLEPGEAFGNVFDVPGSYGYHSTLHRELKGVIVVTAVAATPPPSGPTPPPGTLPPNFHTPVPASTTPSPPAPSPSPAPGDNRVSSAPALLLGGVLVVAIAAAVLAALAIRRGR